MDGQQRFITIYLIFMIIKNKIRPKLNNTNAKYSDFFNDFNRYVTSNNNENNYVP